MSKKAKFYRGKYFIAFYEIGSDELVMEADNPKELASLSGMTEAAAYCTLGRLFPKGALPTMQTAYINGRRCAAYFIDAFGGRMLSSLRPSGAQAKS